MKTKLFKACRGVFEGGGCLGAAYVGAYEAAVNAGVRFNEVAGTSGGSIIAALIGAGASVEYLKKTLLELDFKQFLEEPEKVNLHSGFWMSVLKKPPLGWFIKKPIWGRFLLYGGAYSSQPIQTWIEKCLSEVLPDARQPIKFRDLVIPTSIVSTDLASGVAKVWSTEDTPDEEVALAVRSSSAIPIFFQPVTVGNNRYVDGAVLSNLPTFVFSSEKNKNSLGGPVLAFSLEGETHLPNEWNITTFLTRLINTVMGGSTDLQTQIQPGVHRVFIPTLGIKTTDFDTMNQGKAESLMKSGHNQTLQFIKNEGLEFQSELSLGNHAADVEELYVEFVREALNPGQRLIVSDNDTYWFWKLFPTILAWRMAGAKVNVLTIDPIQTGDQLAREMQRRTLLEKIGASVDVVASLPVRGFFIERVDDNRGSAFVLNDSKNAYGYFASIYTGRLHRSIVQILHHKLFPLISDPEKSNGKVKVVSSDPDPLIKRLKHGVTQYSPSDVEMKLEKVKVSDMITINRRVRAFKYYQIENLAKAFSDYGVPPFRTATIFDNDGNIVSELTPPVLEKRGDKSVALEGNTRVLYAFHNNIEELEVLHVRGVKEPLPGKPTALKSVLLSSRVIDLAERIQDRNQTFFRSIEAAARPIN